MAMMLKKGGLARLIVEGAKNNDVVTIPAGFRVDAIVAKKVGTTAGTLKVGTTQGGDEVVTAAALGTVDGALVNFTVKIPNYGVDTPVYIGLSNAAASGDVTFILRKLF